MARERIETIADPQVTITCQGDLVVRSTVESSVLIKGDSFTVAADNENGANAGPGADAALLKAKEAPVAPDPTAEKVAERTIFASTVDINSHGDLVVQVPRQASLVLLDTVGGDVSLRNIGGGVTAADIAGDVALATVGGSVTLDTVHGDCAASDIAGDFSVSTAYGDLVLTRVDGESTLGIVHGDVAIKSTAGGLTISSIMGDMAARAVGGDLTIGDVHGDCRLAHLGGVNTVHVTDDLRISGGLRAGEHNFSADSTLSLRWPAGEPLILNASAPAIRNRIAFDSAEDSDGVLNGIIGQDGPVVNLHAGEKITLKEMGSSSKSQGASFEFDFDAAGWAEFGEMISREVSAKMDAFATQMSDQFGPDFAAQMEQHAQRAAEKAQRAAERAMRKAEAAMRKAEQRVQRESARAQRRAPKPPRPPKPPSAKAAPAPTAPVDTKSEQLKILKMLEEGKISLDEANMLLEALG